MDCKMELIDTSSHMCLICHQTVIGLFNYVEHFKSHATAQESKAIEAKFTDENTKCEVTVSQTITSGTKRDQKPEREVLNGDPSPIHDLPVELITDPDIETAATSDQNAYPDFFQSLELKSITEETPSNARLKAVQRLSVLEDDTQAELLLPITSILSNLDFSSDDDFLGISDAEDCDENLLLDHDTESQTHPPPGHSGGKWRPGEGPKRRMPIAGKWRPGQKPGPACRKTILRKPAKVKGPQAELGKSFYCNVCHSFFMDRNAYSLHFGQSRHQEMAAAKQLERSQQSTSSERLEHSEKQRTSDTQINSMIKEGQSEGTGSTKAKDSFHCKDCNLYFNNSVVFATHCETKLHKDAVLQRQNQDIQSEDGALHTDTVLKQTQETIQPTPSPHKNSAETTEEKPPESVEEQESHHCPICMKYFTRKYEMARHLLTRMHGARARHHPQAASLEMLDRYNKYMVRLMPFQCGVCRFYFNKQKDFLDHMGSLTHLKTCEDLLGPVLCVPCKFKTHKHEEMMEHLQSQEHFCSVEKKFGICVVKESHTRITCKFCGVHMHSAVRMNQHCLRKHKDRMSNMDLALNIKQIQQSFHKCPLCEKKFKSKSLLQLHFLKVHKNKYLFNCTICKRGFLDQRRLDNHLRTRFHAKRVVASKLKENLAKEKLVDASQALGPEQRKSRRRKKAVKFFEDRNEEEQNQNMLKVTKNSKTKTSTSKLKITSSLEPETEGKKKPKQTKQLHKTTLGQNKNVGDKASLKPVTDLSGQNKSIGIEINKKKVLDCSRPGMELINDIQLPEMTKDGLLPSQTEQEDEDMILEEEAEEDEGEIIPETDVELDEEEHARVNEASLTIFSCTYCEFAATDLLELRAHYSSCHPQEILTCQPCDQYFLSLKAYKIHCAGRGHQLKLREISGETTIHKCRLCDKRFLQEFSCKLHLETVHRHPSSEEDLRRLHKGQDLVTQLYGEHIKQVEALTNETSVSCPECGKFVRKDTLVEHLRLHTGERPYTCRFCGHGFAGRLTLRRHLSGHLNMPLFMCDLCGKGFKRNALLQRHIKQHEYEKRGEKHTCKVCKAWFYTAEELSRHSRRHGDRNFHCTWPGCDWSFILAGELKSHMYTHTGEKKYLCDQCGFGAPTKTRLRRHAKCHQQTKTFACEYCPYKASIKTHLKRHMRIHINSKPFKCPYCKYTCNTHENMRKHILRTQKHKGKKLYPCHLCNTYGSDSSREFKAHLMTVHADYLKENAVDSLAVFSGLYKREEDFQKPKEGSEIIQVTKGRFFRKYQNVNLAPPTHKDRKCKGKASGSAAIKRETLRVKIVPPEEIHQDLNTASDEDVLRGQKHSQTQRKQEQVPQPANMSMSHAGYQHDGQLPALSQQYEVVRAVGSAAETSQHTKVTPIILQSFKPHGQDSPSSSFSSQVQIGRQEQVQQQHPAVLASKPIWTVRQDTDNQKRNNQDLNQQDHNYDHNHQHHKHDVIHHHHNHDINQHHIHNLNYQQHNQNPTNHNNPNLNPQHHNIDIQVHHHDPSFQQVPYSQQQQHILPQPSKDISSQTVKHHTNSERGGKLPKPEPWYSGMPQVHAPSSPELPQSFKSSVKVQDLSAASLDFPAESDYLCQVPGTSQPQPQQATQILQSLLTSADQIYTVNLTDVQGSKTDQSVVLSSENIQLYFSG